MTRIILIGYMGSGKTTLGNALARELGLPFFDLDWYIENRFCRTVTRLFEERGEEGFRRIEHEMLHEVAEFEDVVIAAGGGTPCFFDNIDYMNRQAQTVYLKATPEVLFRHLLPGRQKRPLLAGKTDEEMRAYIIESLARRAPFYERANYIFDVNLLETRQQIQASLEQLRTMLNL
ncbi:shikimate kinase [Bacteroides sp. Marseille-P3684]|uniref:shikimate kinase n=1 Tax=Bacteroides sp. Marseille-P3684 TaxID=2086579 RepID=UPI000D0B4BA9|nr:shikimate kinase [Bacteroides sp. Marseille-P3684]